MDESMQQNKPVYDNQNAFANQFDDYFRLDLRFAYRTDGKKVSQEWVFDIQNVTNRKNPLYATFDAETGEEKVVNQLGFMPMMQYRITF